MALNTTKIPQPVTRGKIPHQVTSVGLISNTRPYSHVIQGEISELPAEGKLATGGCTLVPETQALQTQVHQAANEGIQLLMFELHIESDGETISNPRARQYKPYTWVTATSQQALMLLFLPPAYQIMSLYTLSSDVKTIHVTVKELPGHCLHQLSSIESEQLMRDMVMNNFQNKSDSRVHVDQARTVCNMHILNETGTAVFMYWCCEQSADSHTKCYYLKHNILMKILFMAITIFKLVIALYSPKLVPDSLYRVKSVAMNFIHTLDKTLSLKVLVSKKHARRDKGTCTNRFRLEQFEGMTEFTKLLCDLPVDEIHTLEIDNLSLLVAQHRLLQENQVPVGFLNVIYDLFVNCKIRERKSVQGCCVALCCPGRCGSVVCYWYIFLRLIMHIVIVLLLFIPWVVRLFVYYFHEHREYELMKTEANLRDLSITYQGNLTLYLQPEHNLFLAVYCVIGLNLLIYQLQYFSTQHYNTIAKDVILQCFNDMRENDLPQNLGYIVKKITKPCKRWGICGLCASVIIFPVTCIVFILYFAFYCIPTINIILRLCAHIFVFLCPSFCSSKNPVPPANKKKNPVFQSLREDAKKTFHKMSKTTNNQTEKHKKTKTHRLLQLLIILFCLSSLFSFILLFFELLSFAVEVLVFTLIGVILHASKLLNYVSFLFLLFIYVNDCFGTVKKNFSSFNNTLNDYIFSKGKVQAMPVIKQCEADQPNTAFMIHSSASVQAPVELTSSRKGLPRWKVKNLVLFISSKDEPMIPKHFVFETCKMPFYNAPGDLLINYIQALGEFILILFFLMFVLLVVLAFGHTYEISATNQMLATTAGGIAPFLVKNFMFRSRVTPVLDTSNMAFQTKLVEHITTYERTWPIHDIEARCVSRSAPQVNSWSEDECAAGDTTKHQTINTQIEMKQLIQTHSCQIDTENQYADINSEDKSKVDLLVVVSE